MVTDQVTKEEDRMRMIFVKAVLFFMIISGIAAAQGINDGVRLAAFGTSSGVRALGMGNAYTALSDDGTGMFYNPAGLGLIRKLEFAGNLDYFSSKNSVSFLGNKSNYTNSTTNFSGISFVFPFPTLRGSFVVGAGYSTSAMYTGGLKFDGFNGSNTSLIQSLALSTDVPFDLFLTDDDGNTKINGKLNQSGNTLDAGYLDDYSFSGALEVYKNLFVGVTLNLTSGVYKNSREYYEDDTQGNYDTTVLAPGYNYTRDFQTFYINRTLDWEIQGWDMKLGMLYQMSNSARVGMKIQFPKSYTVKEKFYTTGYADFGGGIRNTLDEEYYQFNTEYDITTPFEFSIGGAGNILGLIVSGEITLTDYTQIEFSNGSNISETDLLAINKDAKEFLRGVMNYNIGVEYLIPQSYFRVRAGYFVQKSPYVDDDPKYDRKYLTFGGGLLVDGIVSVDAAYVMGSYENFGDNYGVNQSRTLQDISTNRLMISFGYRF